jgi:heme o synthase
MLSVVEVTGRASARVSLAYAGAMLVCATIVGLTSTAGALYMGVALLTSLAYIVHAWRFVQHPERAPARRLFFSSIIVLPVLLSALMADLVLLG